MRACSMNLRRACRNTNACDLFEEMPRDAVEVRNAEDGVYRRLARRLRVNRWPLAARLSRFETRGTPDCSARAEGQFGGDSRGGRWPGGLSGTVVSHECAEVAFDAATRTFGSLRNIYQGTPLGGWAGPGMVRGLSPPPTAAIP